MNVVVVRGRRSRPPEVRELPSGGQVVGLEVTVREEGRPADTVPVSCGWEGTAAAAVAGLEAGEEVVVVGRVRRRFFRAGGSTQSRTEVAADAVVPARQAKRAAQAIARAVAPLG